MSVRVLWLDDEIDNLDTFVEKLRELDFVVFPAKDGAGAEAILASESIDLCLVDLNLGGPSGIEFLRAVGPKYRSISYIAFSSYLYRKTYLDQLYALHFPVKIMDKVLPSRDSNEFRTIFVDEIRAYHQSAQKLTPKAAGLKAAAALKEDPFAVTYSSWRNMDVFQRDELQDSAYDRAKDIIERAFDGGASWVMLCGQADVLRATARRPDEILTEEQLMEFGLRQGFVPFCYFRQGQIEELWGGGCISSPDGGSYNGYPTVRFLVGDDIVDFHFDTGSDASYFSYDELRTRNETSNIVHWSRMNLRHHETRDIRISRQKLRLLLHSQEDGGEAMFVDLEAAIVRNWFEFPYVRFCGDTCVHGSGDGSKRLCQFRKGLIGRDLLVANGGVSLTLDGATRKTSFVSHPEKRS